jgi:hypothetical protein
MSKSTREGNGSKSEEAGSAVVGATPREKKNSVCQQCNRSGPKDWTHEQVYKGRGNGCQREGAGSDLGNAKRTSACLLAKIWATPRGHLPANLDF